MRVLTVRAHKRYAIRRTLGVSTQDGFQATALLIEISADGCRLSNLGKTKLAVGDRIDAALDEIQLDGLVRWCNDGVVGLRFTKPLHTFELSALISPSSGPQQLRYGT